LARAVYLAAAHSPHVVDVDLFALGLHRDPSDLRSRLQDAIDATDPQVYDAIALGYGLCGKSTDGLTSRHVPMILPRAHDCITLFLGDRQRYAREFETCPGTYWYSQDYIERNEGDAGALSLGAEAGSDIESAYDEYVAKYGEDNARYLMDVMGAWQSHYERAAYIDLGLGNGQRVEKQAREEADARGWRFETMTADLVLLKRLIDGQWDAEQFLLVEPGHRIAMSGGSQIVMAVCESPPRS
jgi:hypothetical protein